ncbi:MAG: hypothetical protein IPP86_01200 [Bacteroidetes bacterium]|nr:hypothetical protein [Bacteroidota bacterium]
MKIFKNLFKAGFATLLISGLFSLNACQKTDDMSPMSSTGEDPSLSSERHCNSILFPAQAHMYGKSYGEWAAELFKWTFQFDCTHSPYLDQTGAFQNQNQHGHVFFLAGAPSGTPVTRSVTVPRGKSVFFPLIYYFANTGCGELLSAIDGDVRGIVPYMDQLTLTIDGQTINNVTDYQAISPIFNYVGDPCFNSNFCIDGTQQQAVIGGYWIMLKPLSRGTHTIHTTGGASALFPAIKDVTWTITQL